MTIDYALKVLQTFLLVVALICALLLIAIGVRLFWRWLCRAVDRIVKHITFR